jgi:PTS system nitrogen regulatory IIA component
MQITDFLTVERILPEMTSTRKHDALVELASLIAGQQGGARREEILRVLIEREQLASTAIGDEIAIPHGKLEGMDGLMLGIGRCPEGLDFESVDGKPTRIFFVLLAPENSTGIHLKALARISRLCKSSTFRRDVLRAAGPTEIYEVVSREDATFYDR